MVTKKLKAMEAQIPAIPREVFGSSHDRGTLMIHKDTRVKTMVIIVWPAPLMIPFDTETIAKNT